MYFFSEASFLNCHFGGCQLFRLQHSPVSRRCCSTIPGLPSLLGGNASFRAIRHHVLINQGGRCFLRYHRLCIYIYIHSVGIFGASASFFCFDSQSFLWPICFHPPNLNVFFQITTTPKKTIYQMIPIFFWPSPVKWKMRVYERIILVTSRRRQSPF